MVAPLSSRPLVPPTPNNPTAGATAPVQTPAQAASPESQAPTAAPSENLDLSPHVQGPPPQSLSAQMVANQPSQVNFDGAASAVPGDGNLEPSFAKIGALMGLLIAGTPSKVAGKVMEFVEKPLAKPETDQPGQTEPQAPSAPSEQMPAAEATPETPAEAPAVPDYQPPEQSQRPQPESEAPSEEPSIPTQPTP